MLTYFEKGIELGLFVAALKNSYPTPSKDEQIVLAIMDKMISDLLEDEQKNNNRLSLKRFKTKHFNEDFDLKKENVIKKYELNLYSDKEPFLVIEFSLHQEFLVLSIFHSFEETDKPWNLFFSKE